MRAWSTEYIDISFWILLFWCLVRRNTETMLRLSIVKNFNFLSKTITTQLDVPICAKNLVPTAKFNGLRQLSLTTARFCDSHKEGDNNEEGESGEEGEKKKGFDITTHWRYKKWAGTPRDRSKVIPYETSIQYMKSSAFKSTYGDKKVWELYRRVHKGQFPRKLTRRDCISYGTIAFGSPCPICRDEYLVLDYRNLELLKMFISPDTGEVNWNFEPSIPEHFCNCAFWFNFLGSFIR